MVRPYFVYLLCKRSGYGQPSVYIHATPFWCEAPCFVSVRTAAAGCALLASKLNCAQIFGIFVLYEKSMGQGGWVPPLSRENVSTTA